MKALHTFGRDLLIALSLATVTLGGGLLMAPLMLGPLTPLVRLLLRLARTDNRLGVESPGGFGCYDRGLRRREDRAGVARRLTITRLYSRSL
jgi:hypothetical protein